MKLRVLEYISRRVAKAINLMLIIPALKGGAINKNPHLLMNCHRLRSVIIKESRFSVISRLRCYHELPRASARGQRFIKKGFSPTPYA